MNYSDRKMAIMAAKLNGHKKLIEKTRDFIKHALTFTERPYVACSFGKDSSVMLDLILSVRPGITVKFASHPETRILDNYQEVINKWLDRGINYQEIFCDGGFFKIKHHQRNSLNAGNWDAFFVGIRAEESFGRRVSLRKFGKIHCLANGIYKICPMAWWKKSDIMIYILSRNIPILNKYKKIGFSERTTSGIPRDHEYECVTALKNMDIQNFNKLCKLFPEAMYFG